VKALLDAEGIFSSAFLLPPGGGKMSGQAARLRMMQHQQNKRGNRRESNWSTPYGGCDADGNPVTVSFGSGKAEGETFLADGDQSEINFFDHSNHDHYGSGNGPNNNGTRRGRYTGRGS
jgi:hypothetical protein